MILYPGDDARPLEMGCPFYAIALNAYAAGGVMEDTKREASQTVLAPIKYLTDFQ